MSDGPLADRSRRSGGSHAQVPALRRVGAGAWRSGFSGRRSDRIPPACGHRSRARTSRGRAGPSSHCHRCSTKANSLQAIVSVAQAVAEVANSAADGFARRKASNRQTRRRQIRSRQAEKPRLASSSATNGVATTSTGCRRTCATFTTAARSASPTAGRRSDSPANRGNASNR